MKAMNLHISLRLAALGAVLMLPAAAEASGSWAVPRFTPTWAELERDLKLLGIKAPAKRATVRRPTPKKPVAVAEGGTKPIGTGPVEGGVKPGDETGSTTGAGDGRTGEGTVAGTVQPGGQCKCPEAAPVPVQVRCPVNEAVEPANGKAATDKQKRPAGKEPAAPKKIQRKKYWWQDE